MRRKLRADRPRRSRAAASAFVVAVLTGAVAACSPSSADPLAGPFEAWETDTPARITFPPVGLEEFTHELDRPAHVELAIHLDREGGLVQLSARRVSGLDAQQVDALLAAIRHARFAPARRDGQPVASIKRVVLDFDPLAGYPVATASGTTGAR
jgi:hypothetical protein